MKNTTRIYRLQGMLWVCFLVLFTCYGCGGDGSESSDSETGKIKFSVVSPEDRISNLYAPENKETMISKWVDRLFSVDSVIAESFLEQCDSGAMSIEAEILDSNGKLIVTGGPWPCSYHKASIQNVSPGSGFSIKVSAIGDDNTSLYHGDKSGLSVLAGQTTDAGKIDLIPSATKGFITMSDGAEIYYEMAGSGEPVILIHGGEQTSESWQYQFDMLSENYWVIRYDIRYFGQSSATGDHPIFTWSWGDEQHRAVTDLVEIMAYMNISRANLCGISLGSAIAAQMAVFHPDMVGKLILGSPWAGENFPDEAGNNFPEDEVQMEVLRVKEDETFVIMGEENYYAETGDYMNTVKVENGYAPMFDVIEGSGQDCNIDQPVAFNDNMLAWLNNDMGGVRFPDPVLEAEIRKNIGKFQGNIQETDLLNITELNLSSENKEKGIKNIEGMQYIKDLVSLDLSYNYITDLTPLSGLTNLTELNLKSNDIVDLTPLSGLTKLNNLDLSYNEIIILYSLAGLTKIAELDLRANDIVKLTALSGLTNIVQLDLGSNDIVYLTPLSGLTKLTDLDLYGNDIEDLTPLSGLTKLTDLDLSDNEIVILDPLSGLTNLEALDLDGNDIVELTPLSGLINLYTLNLSYNEIVKVNPLAGAVNLKRLYLAGNEQLDSEDISSLSNLNNLYKINISNIQLDNLEPLLNLKALSILFLSNNQQLDDDDIITLSSLSTLRQLDLSYTGFSNIGQLSNLILLKSLDLSGNGISYIAPLSGLTNLTYLNLYGNGISYIAPLSGLTNLTYLNLSENDISNVDSLSNLTNLSSLDLSGNEIENIDSLSNLTNLSSLYLSRNEIENIDSLSNLTNLNDGYISYFGSSYKRYALYIYNNQITDLTPLLNNPGIGSGDTINVRGNSLSTEACTTQIPQLETRGATIYHSCP